LRAEPARVTKGGVLHRESFLSVTPVSAVPEPSLLVLIALGVPAIAIAMRRRFASIVRTNS